MRPFSTSSSISFESETAPMKASVFLLSQETRHFVQEVRRPRIVVVVDGEEFAPDTLEPQVNASTCPTGAAL